MTPQAMGFGPPFTKKCKNVAGTFVKIKFDVLMFERSEFQIFMVLVFHFDNVIFLEM
jgi:hypothetical protein